MIMNISGADVRTAREAQDFLANLATVYRELVTSADQFIGNQSDDGVSGEPIVFLSTMRDQAAATAAAMTAAANRAAAHRARLADTIGADPSLAGTQTGGYSDVAGL